MHLPTYGGSEVWNAGSLLAHEKFSQLVFPAPALSLSVHPLSGCGPRSVRQATDRAAPGQPPAS